MTLREYWDYTIKWGGELIIRGVWLLYFCFYRKWLIHLYYFWNWCVFYNKKRSKVNIIPNGTFRLNVLFWAFNPLTILAKKLRLRYFIGSSYLFCSLVGICSVCISNMIMIVCVHCSFLIWFSPMIFILHLQVLPRSFIKWGGGN